MGTAILSAGAGLLIVAASDHIHAAYVAIILPGGLWFSKMPAEHLVPRTVADWLALPFRRLYDRMGDDMQDWCETRLKAAAPKPQWIADAVTYYHIQVRGRLKDAQAQARLGDWQESITHKIEIVRLIELDTTRPGCGRRCGSIPTCPTYATMPTTTCRSWPVGWRATR